MEIPVKFLCVFLDLVKGSKFIPHDVLSMSVGCLKFTYLADNQSILIENE